MAPLPYIPIYVDTYIAETQLLTLEEHGAYNLLMYYMWINGGKLPNDDKIIARYLKITAKKWKNIRKNLAEFFVFSEKNFTHHHVEDAYKKASEKSMKCSESAHKRWSKPAESLDQEGSLNVSLCEAIPMPSHKQSH